MTNLRGRLLAGILIPLAIGGTLAGCGDDDTTPASSSGGGAQTAPGATASAADIDRAFVRQMIPHHQMAVEMAELAETEGQRAELKELAADIIAAQTEELDQLEEIENDLGADAASDASMSKDAQTLGLTMEQMGMAMDTDALAEADPFDLAFIDQMTPHHEGAIAMAGAVLARGENAPLKAIATAIVSAQKKELAQLATWKADWYPDAAAPSSAGDAKPNGETPHMGH